MGQTIILIGPIGAGKSTQGALLAARLGLPRGSMDERRWEYYKERGYDEDEARKRDAEEGFPGVYRYWKPFEAYAVERLLEDYPEGVLDFGGGHSVYEDDTLFAQVQTLLAPYPHVALLLPSPDLDESVRLLKARGWDGKAGDLDLHEHFVKHHSNHDLAKYVIYTHGKTPEETCDEILARVQT